jgi:hypothetical protein
MIRNRRNEAVLFILGAIALALLGFYTQGIKIDLNQGITGYAVLEQKNENNVVVSGIGVDAEVKGMKYHYIFSDDHNWYESKDLLKWEMRPDMGDNLFKGILYLQSYDAKIYYNDEEVKSIEDLMEKMKRNV